LAREDYNLDPDISLDRLRSDLNTVIKPGKAYAVRSSAELEDGAEFSFAGQFKTVLRVRGVENMILAILEVWDSADSIKNIKYGQRLHVEQGPANMGVLIQEMVDPVWAGVGFSINPVNGRDEILIEGVKGSAVKFIQDGINPVRWIFRQGGWDPDPGVDTGTGSPGIEVLERLVSGIKKLKADWKSEVDVEWVFDGKDLYYLQSRLVTALKYPTIYSNHLSREFLPGMIKPLVWSVNISLVNNAWIQLLKNILGPLDISPEQLSRAFYYRAYFNMGTMGAIFRQLGLPRESLEYLMGIKESSGKKSFRPGIRTIKFLPRIIWFLLSNLSPGKKFLKWSEKAERKVSGIEMMLDRQQGYGKYKELFSELMIIGRQAAYFNILIPLTMYVSDGLLKKRLKRLNINQDTLDFPKDFPLWKRFDPQYEIRRLHLLWKQLPEEVHSSGFQFEEHGRIAESGFNEPFRTAFNSFMERFGFFSESGNDFSHPHWDEDPGFVLDLIRNARQESGDSSVYPSGETSSQAVPRLGSVYRRAGRYRLYREMVSTEYTREYGLFRKLFLQTGDELVRNGKLEDAGDVFYLTLEEHNRLLEATDKEYIALCQSIVSGRKQEMIDFRDISLPSVIYGEIPPPLPVHNEKLFRGLPTSPGHFEGNTVVVRSYEDFNKKVEDAILIIPFADVGWTPVLARAGAIISESGGMLSHAAIVARELSIPSISSVDHVSQLKDGLRARVDGYNGVLMIID